MMERRPEFTIVAGPNGAGKSRLGAFYSRVKAFDGDALALQLRQEHPDWKASWVEGTVITTLMREVEEAIAQRRDYAFETNFTSPLVPKLMDDFRAAGYKISLVYFGLPSVEASVKRVEQRFFTGGHNVEQSVIEYNFHEGIRHVSEALPAFENVLFIDGSADFGDVVAIHIGKSNKHEITDHPAPWFEQYFKSAFETLTDHLI